MRFGVLAEFGEFGEFGVFGVFGRRIAEVYPPPGVRRQVRVVPPTATHFNSICVSVLIDSLEVLVVLVVLVVLAVLAVLAVFGSFGSFGSW